MQIPEVKSLLDTFHPIGLEEMDNVRLMDRVDTKYVMPVHKISHLLHGIGGGYKALEINNIKTFPYQTTYIDSCDFHFFNQHVTGKLERNKVRYRRYDTTGTTYLEVKKTTNKNRTIKWRFENELTADNQCDNKAYEFIKTYLPLRSLSLKPVLICNFSRVTLVGAEVTERLTIDFDLSYSDMTGNQICFPFIAIVELKQQGFSNRSPVMKLLKGNALQPNSFSKYCIGTSLFYDIPKKNILKPKFLLINKIENEYNRSFTC